MKTIFTIIIILITGNTLLAQHARFIKSGSIEFEKTINMFAVVKLGISMDNSISVQQYDLYRKNQPQFRKLKSTLTFSDNKTLFVPEPRADVKSGLGDSNPASTQINLTYTDLTSKTSVTQKNVLGEFFLVKDSTRKIVWKITDETREIAGYTCRRANGLIMDSVYVVAFYTNKIPVFGGPESFTGLPGMILGVALPHENVTWFATKVNDIDIPANSVIPPKKGKPVNNKQLYETLKEAMKNQGIAGPYELKTFLL